MAWICMDIIAWNLELVIVSFQMLISSLVHHTLSLLDGLLIMQGFLCFAIHSANRKISKYLPRCYIPKTPHSGSFYIWSQIRKLFPPVSLFSFIPFLALPLLSKFKPLCLLFVCVLLAASSASWEEWGEEDIGKPAIASDFVVKEFDNQWVSYFLPCFGKLWDICLHFFNAQLNHPFSENRLLNTIFQELVKVTCSSKSSGSRIPFPPPHFSSNTKRTGNFHLILVASIARH